MSSHAGTHIGVPLDGVNPIRGMDPCSFSAATGLATVIEIQDKQSVKAEEIQEHRIDRHDRILLKSRNSSSDPSSPSFNE